MKPKLYIISGWCDTTGRAPYQRIADIAKGKGYEVVKINPDWNDFLSRQIFPINKNDVIFGFSMGAVLACMIGQKYCCDKLILASMTPVCDLSKFTFKILGRKLAADCRKFKYGNLYGGIKATYFYGEKEIDSSLNKIRNIGKKMGAEFKIVPNTAHHFSMKYVDYIAAEL